MKGRFRWVVPLAVLMLATSSSRVVASEDAPRNVISIEPLAVVFARTIALEYERGFGHFGLHFGVALALGDVSITEPERDGDYLALALTTGLRFYPWSQSPRGAFVDPFVTVAWISAEAQSGEELIATSGVGWAAGAIVGWTWLLGTSFVVSAGVGAAYYELSLDGDEQPDARGRRGWLPTLRLAVGAAF